MSHRGCWLTCWQVLDEPLYASFLSITGLARPYRDLVLQAQVRGRGRSVVWCGVVDHSSRDTMLRPCCTALMTPNGPSGFPMVLPSSPCFLKGSSGFQESDSVLTRGCIAPDGIKPGDMAALFPELCICLHMLAPKGILLLGPCHVCLPA